MPAFSYAFELQELALPLVGNLVLAVYAWRRKLVSRSGFIGGALLGSWILILGGGGAYLLLCAFFGLGTAATHLGYRRKAEKGLAQEEEGRRGARHVLANCGVGLLLVLLFPSRFSFALGAAYVAAFATATADTLGSEIGQLWGRRTYDPLRLRRVERGSEGAVSLEGTCAGALGAGILAVLGAILHFYPYPALWIPLLAGVLGSGLESLLGSSQRIRGRLDNEALNFLNTVVGALLAWTGIQILF
jgi:uncharacterized protein (TIGR00297 family)